ncbi:MAG: rod-binding protein [Magnetospirillum sp.]|nr:rod-binding protein [Magnetospirillum sp.]
MNVDVLSAQGDLAVSQSRSTPAMQANSPEQAKAVGKKFEAMFVTQMMSHMFEGVSTDGVFGGGHAEGMFRPMLLEEYGKMVANRAGGIGIADQVARTLLKTQEV